MQASFAEYLTQQRALGRQTIATDRDAFVPFLEFARHRLGKSPTAITLADMTPGLITAFINHPEEQRHNCASVIPQVCWSPGCVVAAFSSPL